MKVDNALLFQSLDEVEFPGNDNQPVQIPHIIHQIFTSDSIPQVVAPLVETLIRNNPSWTYMFWTYESGMLLIKRQFPHLLEAYNSSNSYNGVGKSDILRYAVLYAYGGVYVDLDVASLRPFDQVTRKTSCSIPPEPFEHAVIYRQYILSTAVMLCRPKHGFFKFVLDNINQWGTDENKNPVFGSGPVFLTNMFTSYYKMSPNMTNEIQKGNYPYFYQDDQSNNGNDRIYIPSTQHFMDTPAPFIIRRLNKMCSGTNTNIQLSIWFERACAEFSARRKVRQSRKFAFTVHYWFRL